MARLSDQPLSNRPSSEPVANDEPCQNEGEPSADALASKSFQALMSSHLGNDLKQRDKAQMIAPISLAYIGDAVFELYVRSRFLIPAKRIRDYHQLVVAQVKAERQAHYVDVLLPQLTPEEKDLLRRGRNATTGRHRRASGQDYQKATGFEALIGFLYLSDQERLWQLLNFLEI